MKCMIIVILAAAVAVQAKPYYDDMDPLYGGYYSSGGSYGNSGYGSGNHGYSGGAHGSRILKTGHDIGHRQDDFDSSVHHHQETDHNIGGVTQMANHGHRNAGYGGYSHGRNMFGRHYSDGYF